MTRKGRPRTCMSSRRFKRENKAAPSRCASPQSAPCARRMSQRPDAIFCASFIFLLLSSPLVPSSTCPHVLIINACFNKLQSTTDQWPARPKRPCCLHSDGRLRPRSRDVSRAIFGARWPCFVGCDHLSLPFDSICSLVDVVVGRPPRSPASPPGRSRCFFPLRLLLRSSAIRHRDRPRDAAVTVPSGGCVALAVVALPLRHCCEEAVVVVGGSVVQQPIRQ